MRSLFLAVFMSGALSVTSASATPARLVQGSVSELRTAAKGWLQNLSSRALQTVTAAGAAGLIVCSGLTMAGCDRGRSVLDVTSAEYVDPGDENAGQYVNFYIDNQLYEGYWELTPDGQLLIEIDDGYDRLVLLEYMTGRLIRNHPDVGAEVVVQGLRNGRDVDKYGEVVEVYDNGFYIVVIDEVVYVHNNLSISTNETLLASPDALPEDGGIQFLDDE